MSYQDRVNRIESRPIAELSSPRFRDISRKLMQKQRELIIAEREVASTERRIASLEKKIKMRRSISLWARIAAGKIARFEKEVMQFKIHLRTLRDNQERLGGKTQIDLGEYNQNAYQELRCAFNDLLACERIWVLIEEKFGVQYRSTAQSTVERRNVLLGHERFGAVHSEHDAYFIANAKGSRLWLYPKVLAVAEGHEQVALIDLREVMLKFSLTLFHEDGSVPSDTSVKGQTWRFANKDGSPDRRFAKNFPVPIVRYATLHFTSPTGLNEAYMFSNPEKVKRLVAAFRNHVGFLTGD